MISNILIFIKMSFVAYLSIFSLLKRFYRTKKKIRKNEREKKRKDEVINMENRNLGFYVFIF